MAKPAQITIAQILEQQSEALKMKLLVGEAGLQRYIDHPRLQKPSLAFAGFIENLSDYRLQVIGKTELHFLETRTPEQQHIDVNAVFDLRLAGVVITRGLTPPPLILEAAKRTDTPLIQTDLDSSSFMTHMTVFLSHALAPVAYQHGVYMDVYGIGVILLGESGIGKSEIGLELITRGHRLIADDMVQLVRQTPSVLVGQSPESLRYHMEIRGLGILDIRNIFGAAGITDTKRVRLIVNLIRWSEFKEEQRFNSEDMMELHGVVLPVVNLPIRPGRSMAVLIELAARSQLLRLRGINSTLNFTQALQQRIQDGN
ncbi:MAG: HPr(Ser) kinase/phosphatase [Zetaproteobacteria bacterium CG2_30_46_52]|nr:MAG: HPr(Ser) kinase/phosphatase [Zetaproteobacteria bacterium CG2_30_46_52]